MVPGRTRSSVHYPVTGEVYGYHMDDLPLYTRDVRRESGGIS